MEHNQRTSRRSARDSNPRSSTTDHPHQQPRQRAKSSSRLISILGNIERTIISQFGSSKSSAISRNSSSNNNTSAKSKIAKKFNPFQTSNLNNSYNSPQQQHPRSTSPQLGLHQEKNKSSLDCRGNEQQVQRDNTGRVYGSLTNPEQQINSNNNELNTSTAKPASFIVQDNQSAAGFCHTTLSKCQQRIVSTMRPNHNHPSTTTAKSNKLYIPPPHANEQLRNQNQRLIFGETSLPPSNNNAYATNKPASLPLLPDTTSLGGGGGNGHETLGRSGKKSETLAKIDDASSLRLQNNSARTIARINHKTSANRQSATPPPVADSGPEKSFSTIHRDASSSSSWADQSTGGAHSSTNDSGFSSYKSPYPLSSNSNTQPNQSEQQETTQNKMMSLYGSNFHHGLAPSPANGYNPHQTRMNTQQHLMYRYPLNQPQHNALGIPNQHSSLASCHQLSMPDLSSHVINHNMYPEHSFDNHYPTTLYHPNHLMTDQSYQDNSHEIYANAPPKPKRYQYYTQNLLTNQQIVTSQLQPSIAPSMIVSTAPHQQTYSSAFQYNNNQIASRQPLNPAHQHPMLNYSYPNQAVSQQYLPSVSYNNHPYMNHQSNTNYTNQTTNQIQIPPHPLIRSKSSLAAEDFIFRANSKQHPPINYLAANQYPLYGTNYQQSNRYSANINLTNYNQQTQQFVSQQRTNLQRSKSVTQLASEYDIPLMTSDAQPQLSSNISNPKFLSHSISSTNLSILPASVNPLAQQRFPVQQQHHIDGLSRQLHRDNTQPQHPAVSSSISEQSSRQSSIPALVSRTEQSPPASNPYPRNQHFNSTSQNQWGVNGPTQHSRINNQPQDLHRIALTHKQHHYQNLPRDKSVLESRLSRLSLDDKIKCLMIGNDSGSSLMVKHQLQDNSSTAKTRQTYVSNAASGSPKLSSSSHLENSAKTEESTALDVTKDIQPGFRQNNPKAKSLLSDNANHQSSGIYQNSANLIDRFTLTSGGGAQCGESSDDQRIYMNDSFKFNSMGNRQQNQYRPNQVESNLSRHFAGISMNSQQELSKEIYYKNSPNSHLIVDLTTPRVLAKTQTTLSSQEPSSMMLASKHSSSINQLGLPQFENCRSTISIAKDPPDHFASNNDAGGDTVKPIDKNSPITQHHPINEANERVAPYYYSDLKSEEQRKAFLNIMQQKSLSPPPQLLSRSSDQSSTRLAPAMSVRQLTSDNSQSSNNNHHIHSNKDTDTSRGAEGLELVEKDRGEEFKGSDSLELIPEDEDFIEFQSMDGLVGHSSQFEASQFSASEMNTSSASNSSTSSASTTDPDSLNSPLAVGGSGNETTNATTLDNTNLSSLPANTNVTDQLHNQKPKQDKNKTTIKTGILKNGGGLENNYLSDTDNERDASRYNNVLGTIIDVDVCPIGKLSQSSPVNDQAVC